MSPVLLIGLAAWLFLAVLAVCLCVMAGREDAGVAPPAEAVPEPRAERLRAVA